MPETMPDLDPHQRDALDAAAFRRLLAHLQARPDVQNIDLMILADFCRNCLAKWWLAEAEARGLPVTDAQARERIYAMPYEDWKAAHQTQATPEQRAALAARKRGP